MSHRARIAIVLGIGLGLATVGAAQRSAESPPFSPEDLGVLESPDRDQWQQPEQIMDALGIADGSTVADLGAGGGWFTVRLGHRVGPNGLVYAEDIQSQMIDAIMRRVRDHGLCNVRPILGAPDNPHLPTGPPSGQSPGNCPVRGPSTKPRLSVGMDAILIVDTYPQFRDPVTLLRHVAAALAPNGRLGIVDFKKDGAGGPGPPLNERIDPEKVREKAAEAGLKFLRQETFLRYQFLLIFGK